MDFCVLPNVGDDGCQTQSLYTSGVPPLMQYKQDTIFCAITQFIAAVNVFPFDRHSMLVIHGVGHFMSKLFATSRD